MFSVPKKIIIFAFIYCLLFTGCGSSTNEKGSSVATNDTNRLTVTGSSKPDDSGKVRQSNGKAVITTAPKEEQSLENSSGSPMPTSTAIPTPSTVPVMTETVDEEPANESNITVGEKNALKKANSYLSYSSFSKEGLSRQLCYEGFLDKEASYAVDNCGADWNEQAVKKAKSYLSYSSFSYEKLIEQLEYEGFTPQEAKYGADNADLNEGDAALDKAKSYLNYSSFSYKGLVEQLEYEGFSHEDAVNAVDNCGADWNEQAVKKAASYLEYSSFSREKLISQLEYEGFTKEQAEYGASQNGV